MVRYEFTANPCSVSRHRSLIPSGRYLVFLWLSLLAVVLVACTTLPKPEMKSLTIAYMIQRQLVQNEKLLVEFQQQGQEWDNFLQELERNMFTGKAGVIYDEPLIGENTPPVQPIESLYG